MMCSNINTILGSLVTTTGTAYVNKMRVYLQPLHRNYESEMIIFVVVQIANWVRSFWN